MNKPMVFLAVSLAALVATPSVSAELPEDIQWTTNMDEPLIGSEEAIRGGTFNYYMISYPLTLRLMGPNSNDSFAGWNRAFAWMGLVAMHPTTDEWIPQLATHWAVMDDNRTIYFKLDPDIRFSDGVPATADDFVFTWEMMQSDYIVDPFYNDYAKQYYESVEAIDEHTLKIVGTRESWRPLYQYAGLWPSPRHAITLDEEWVTRTNNQPQVVVGPYVISEMRTGERITLERVADWWGDGKRYFTGQYNFDRIVLRVIPEDRDSDFFKRGEIDLMIENTARKWAEETNYDQIQKNWIRKHRVFLESPQGIYGMHMNLEAPLFRDKNVRKAMQHLFNFEKLNRNLMFNAYFRVTSAFEGTEFANPELSSYPFDPREAIRLLREAGFTERDSDGTWKKPDGTRAEFTLLFGSKGLEPHMTVVQQDFKRVGVNMRLQMLEAATNFERGLERKYEMTVTGRTAGYYPSPRQYFHSEFKAATNNNNIWGFGTPETDELIETYVNSMDAQERLDAMYKLDAIIHDEAFYIPFWSAPYMRLLYWDYVQFPEWFLPKRTQGLTDYFVYWIDPEKKARLEQAMAANEPLPAGGPVDADPYGVKAAIEARTASAPAERRRGSAER